MRYPASGAYHQELPTTVKKRMINTQEYLGPINMKYYSYIIESNTYETEGTHIYTLRPQNEPIQFIPGQYVFLKDPKFSDPNEEHPFSVTSTTGDNHLEFCIKQYGDWTESFAQRNPGDEVFVSEAQGKFTWDKECTYAVFLLGGIGISPIISMLRTLQQNSNKAEIVMIYGNRTPETIAYKAELEQIEKALPNFKLIHVFSDISDNHPWNGYRGFITKAILEKEVRLANNPTFFFIGPPIFIDKMQSTLQDLGVDQSKMKTETLAQQ